MYRSGTVAVVRLRSVINQSCLSPICGAALLRYSLNPICCCIVVTFLIYERRPDLKHRRVKRIQKNN